MSRAADWIALSTFDFEPGMKKAELKARIKELYSEVLPDGSRRSYVDIAEEIGISMDVLRRLLREMFDIGELKAHKRY